MKSESPWGYQDNPQINVKAPESAAPAAPPIANPVTVFVEKLINLKTMHPWLRGLTITAFVLIGATALLLLSGIIPQPDAFVGLLGSQPLRMPLIAIIGALLLLTIGWAYVIAGTHQTHWAARLVIMAIFTWLSIYYPQNLLHMPGNWHTLGHLAGFAQIGILVTLDGWALAVTWFNWHQRQRELGPRISGQVVTFILVLVLLVGYYVAGAFGSTQSGGIFSGTLGLVLFASNIISQLFFLLIVQNFVVIWSSTDFLEWGEMVTLSVVAGLQRLRVTWLIIALPVLTALAILLDAARMIPGKVALPSLFETVAIALLCIVIVLLAGIDRAWSNISLLTALLVGALYIFLEDELANEISLVFNLAADVTHRLNNVIGLTFGIGAAAVGVILLLWRRGENAPQGRVIGLLLLLIVALRLPVISHNVVDVLGNHIAPLPPFSSAVFLSMVAVIMLVVLLIAAVRGPITATIPIFVNVLFLLVSMRLVFWIFTASENPPLGAQAKTATIVIALTFLAAVLWDVVTSGEQVTNRDSRAFPRAGRTLIYLGYTLIAAAMFVLFSTLQPQVLQSATGSLPLYNLDGPFLAFGITELGIPFIITAFALRLGQSRAVSVAAVSDSATTGPVTTRWLQVALGIIGIGALLFADVAALRTPAPGANSPAHTYTATVPGSDCDFKGALWSTQNTANCLPNGLELTEDLSSPGQYAATILFDLPLPGIAKNYSLAMRMDLSNLSGAPADACAAIVTHITAAGWYITQACRNGDWAIVRVLNSQQTTLKSGNLGHSLASVSMTATADNATYSLAIDGKQLGSAQDATLDQSGAIALTTVSAVPGTSIMSDFAYTPLP